MGELRDTPTPSTANIMQHPIHPLLVVFPISFLVSVPASDLVFLWTGRGFWAEAGFWLSSAGLTIGLIAAVAGMIDFFSMPEVRRHITGWGHFLAGTMALSLAGANVQLRWDDPAAAVWPLGLLLSATLAGVVAVTGWLGGTLTFKHGIGTYGHDEPVEEEGDEHASPEP